MHACVCQWSVCGSLKERRAGAKTWLVVENGNAAKYNNLWSPGDGRVSSIPRFLPAKPPAGHYRSLLSSPAELIPLLPVPDSPFYSPSTHGGSRRSRFSDAAAPSSRRLQSSYHRIPLKRKRTAWNDSLWTCSKPTCHHLVKSYQPHRTPSFSCSESVCHETNISSRDLQVEKCAVWIVGVLGRKWVWLRHVKFATHWCEPGGRKYVASSPLRFVCLNQNFSHPCQIFKDGTVLVTVSEGDYWENSTVASGITQVWQLPTGSVSICGCFWVPGVKNPAFDLNK